MFHYTNSTDAGATEFRFPEAKGLVRKNFYSQYFKRFLDILLVVGSAPVVLPVVALFALLIRRDGGPAFYAQERIGKDGKRFVCWKLRSMVIDADKKLAEYLEANPEAQAEWLVNQKLKKDPRIIKIGHFIRKTSIDELPQFWCIFKGDMSLVGPRPFLPEQEKLYKGSGYYELRPGLTGFWQVGDRSESSFAARAVFDNRYASELTFGTDLSILMRTVGVVVRGTGV